MRLHRFYIENIIDDQMLIINEDRLIHQWRNVFRFNIGGEIIVFNGDGFEYSALIENINNREVGLRIINKRKGIVPDRNITLYQSLIKKDKMEWVIEKATELGVSKIVPIISERSEKKGFNIERARKIAIEASEQCGRADVPIVEGIQKLESGIQNLGDNAIVFDKSGSSFNLESRFKLPASIFIGPEGGWSPEEIKKFKENAHPNGSGGQGVKVYSLGPLTLRAETAAIVALAMMAR